MKIIYSAGDRVGANSQLSRILENLQGHQIKIAAFIKSSESIAHIDWTLDSLYYNKAFPTNKELSEIFDSNIPFVNVRNVKIFLKEAEEFEPDLFIIDGEPIAAHIAKKLNVPIWYCSPLHLLDGVQWERGKLRYNSKLIKLKKILNNLPEPEKIFIYSPFVDIENSPQINSGFEWIKPYHHKISSKLISNTGAAIINDVDRISDLSKILNSVSFDLKLFSSFGEKFSNINSLIINKTNYFEELKKTRWLFTTGETSFVSDAFYNLINLCISPSLDDYESLLNAILITEYNIGTDVSKLELLGKYSIDIIEESFAKKLKHNYLNEIKSPLLHEKI